MKSIILVLPLLFSAAAMANDTSYPAIQFDKGTVKALEGYSNSSQVKLSGGDANSLFNILDVPVGTGPKEYYAANRGLILNARNIDGEPVFVSITCSKADYNFDKNVLVPKATTCSVQIVNGPYQSDLHTYTAPACSK